MEVFWFLPTFGDGRFLATKEGARPITISYLRQLAQATEDLGYGGVLIPSGRNCEDSWSIAAALSQVTSKLKFLVALRPGTVTPTVAARMANTINRLSDGRLLLNVVVGGDPDELAGDGVFADHDDRYILAQEFLDVWRGLQAGKTVDYSGKFVRVRGAELYLFPDRTVHGEYPEFWAGGSSEAGHDFISKNMDVYLTWGERREDLQAKVDDIRRRAEKRGRTVRFGLRFQTVIRDTFEEAARDAERLLQHVDKQTIDEAQKVLRGLDSVGQRRMLDLHGGNRQNLWVEKHLWAGFSLVRGGVGTALVGTGDQIAEVLHDYKKMGFDYFIMSGMPHLEEAYRFAEAVFPHIGLGRADQTHYSLMGAMGRRSP